MLVEGPVCFLSIPKMYSWLTRCVWAHDDLIKHTEREKLDESFNFILFYRFDGAPVISKANFITLLYETASCCQAWKPLSHRMMLTGWYQYLIKGRSSVRCGSRSPPPAAADCSEAEQMEAVRLKISGWCEMWRMSRSWRFHCPAVFIVQLTSWGFANCVDLLSH